MVGASIDNPAPPALARLSDSTWVPPGLRESRKVLGLSGEQGHLGLRPVLYSPTSKHAYIFLR